MRKQGPVSHTIEVEVAFHDVDSMEIVWHGHYLKYLENARWALMDRLGYGYRDMISSGFTWPIVECQLRYIKSARFGDRLSVRASLVEWDSRIAVNYLVLDARTGDRIARGRSVQVAVDAVSGELQFELPACFQEAVERVLARPTPRP